jgi:Zn-dependent protease
VDEDALHPNPVARLSQTTWPLFRAFRVNVRVGWTIALIPLYFAWEFAKWPLPFWTAAGWAAAWTVALYTTIWTHEMGHIAMGRRRGIDTDRITLRALGGLAHLHAPAQSPADEIKISLAGPAVHLVWIAALYPLDRFVGAPHEDATWAFMLHGFFRLQFALLAFNLLPFYPLDGGSALRGALATRIHANRASLVAANVGFVGMGALVVLGALSLFKAWDPFSFGPFGFFMAWLGLWGIQACRQLRMEALYGDVYGEGDPFQKVLIAHHEAMRETDDEERKERRAAQEKRKKLQETADRLLDRINELGGVDKLSASERKELERASRDLAEDG